MERRHHKRYTVKDSTFVALKGEGPSKLGMILDISEGGVAFRYLESNEQFANGNELDIFSSSRVFRLAGLEFSPVMDFPLPLTSSFSLMPMRRQSVKFTDLSPEQRQQLHVFIRKYGNA